MSNKVHDIDSQELIDVLDKFELDTKKDTGIYSTSGAFAKADVTMYDETFFYINLKWGVQSDCTDNPHYESYKINRKTLEIIDE
jgi:hypothetical protein